MVTMDETNTANSSSAAAVADGASAAARTKTVGASTIKSASHVKLLIKSSNQQYEDHVIESDLLWTVKRLKTHLSLVYPSKPPAADQKLIYSGQLLNDNVQLKDVIRSYKDVYTQNHIIHLVYTPKNLPPPPPPVTSSANKTKTTTTSSASATGVATAGQASANNMTTADGLRQRHTAGSNRTGSQSTTASMQQQQQQAMFHQNMYPYFMTPQMMSTVTATTAMHGCPQFPPAALGSPYNVQAMISQQAAMYNWMQQVYSQYMQQCLRLSNTVDSSSSSGTVPSMAATPFRPAFPPEFHQFFQQQFPSTVMPPIIPDATNIATANIAASTDGSTAEGQQEQQQQGQQEPAALGQVAAPRFPNLPQDEHDNRDWLDNFFSITRLALFLTLLYFNSSPLRCLVVVIIAGGIYLYHIGAFRLRHERNNNNLNRNNNAAQNAAVDQIRQGVDQQQNAVAAPANQGQEAANNADNNDSENDETPVQQTETTTSSDAVDNADNESMMSTIRTFVITFFTSLFPETPAL